MLTTINETELECFLAKRLTKNLKFNSVLQLYIEKTEIFRTIILGPHSNWREKDSSRNSITDFILPGPSRTDYLIAVRPTQWTLLKGSNQNVEYPECGID